MKRVPGRVHLVAGECVLGCIALGDHCAIELFYCESLWCKHSALIGSSIRKNRRTFFVQPDSHAAWSRILRNPLELKETAAANDRGFDFVIVIPAVHTTMSIQNLCKQSVHDISPLPYRQQSACY